MLQTKKLSLVIFVMGVSTAGIGLYIIKRENVFLMGV